MAKEIVGDEKNTLKAARKLYDWVATHIRYVNIVLGAENDSDVL